MPKIIILVGPPGSGKSTLAETLIQNDGSGGASAIYINQDTQGKEGHLKLFQESIKEKVNIVVDRMGFNKQQRDRYLKPAIEAGYESEIIVLHVPYEVCFKRCMARVGHPTITSEQNAKDALNTFFTKHERVSDFEADKVTRLGWNNVQPCIVIDIDGTLANVDHRLHFMKGERKNWPGFFKEMVNDTLNKWCNTIINKFKKDHIIVLASGRPDNYKKETLTWLEGNEVAYDFLYMRPRNDSRRDDIVKEIILDFEILPRFKPLFFVDDRKQVVEMYRNRGMTVLQCEFGDF